MLRSRHYRLLLVTLASFVVAGLAAAGPPWIAIEYPANPHDPNTRGAFLTVRTYHHGDLMSYAEAHATLDVPASVAGALRSALS